MLVPNSPRRLALLRTLALLFTLMFLAFAYTFLHEGGHALFGMLFGGELTSFNVDFIGFTAHAGVDGQFAPWQRALISIAGIGLPLSLWTLFLIALRQAPRDNPVLDWMLFIGSIGVYSTLLAWIILPMLDRNGIQASDDSINFLRITGLPPLLVSATALAALAGGLSLFLRRVGGPHGLRERLAAASAWQSLSATAYTTLRSMALILILMIAATLVINLLLEPNTTGRPPAGYSLAFEVGLAERGMQNETVYRFNLDAHTKAGFYFLLLDFQEGPLELAIFGPGSYKFTFLNFDEKPGIGRATVQPEPLLLKPGEYDIRLTAPQGPSTLKGYLKIGP